MLSGKRLESSLLQALGLIVLRQIPMQLLPGLLGGAYKLHGGVLRDAGGRIVAHLLTAGPSDSMKSLVPGLDLLSGLAANGQLFKISRSVEELRSSVQTILQVSATGTALSGLGLVTQAAGVAYLAHRLGGIEHVLAKIEQSLEDLKRAVVTHHLATLKGAMDNLRHAESDEELGRRTGMLLDAKRDFQVARHYYLSRVAEATEPQEFAALEECLTLSMLGAALTASELRRYDLAAADLKTQAADWNIAARRFVRERALGVTPERLLEASPDQVSSGDLVALLDFAEDNAKGWARIDVLRRRSVEKERSGARGLAWPRKVEELQIPMDALGVALALRERDLVLQAQVEHFCFLEKSGISARDFAQAARDELSASGGEAVCIVPAAYANPNPL